MSKTSSDEPPASSGLDNDSFVLVIQTRYQQECWQKHGPRFAGIDATHNTTHYENMSLFTLLVRDRWGHGTKSITPLRNQYLTIVQIINRHAWHCLLPG